MGQELEVQELRGFLKDAILRVCEKEAAFRKKLKVEGTICITTDLDNIIVTQITETLVSTHRQSLTSNGRRSSYNAREQSPRQHNAHEDLSSFRRRAEDVQKSTAHHHFTSSGYHGSNVTPSSQSHKRESATNRQFSDTARSSHAAAATPHLIVPKTEPEPESDDECIIVQPEDPDEQMHYGSQKGMLRSRNAHIMPEPLRKRQRLSTSGYDGMTSAAEFAIGSIISGGEKDELEAIANQAVFNLATHSAVPIAGYPGGAPAIVKCESAGGGLVDLSGQGAAGQYVLPHSLLDYGVQRMSYPVDEMLVQARRGQKHTPAQSYFNEIMRLAAQRAGIWEHGPRMKDVTHAQRERFFREIEDQNYELRSFRHQVWGRLSQALSNRRQYLTALSAKGKTPSSQSNSMAKLMMNIEDSSGDESRLSTGTGYGSSTGNDVTMAEPSRFNMKVFRKKPAIKIAKTQSGNAGTASPGRARRESEPGNSDENSSSVKMDTHVSDSRETCRSPPLVYVGHDGGMEGSERAGVIRRGGGPSQGRIETQEISETPEDLSKTQENHEKSDERETLETSKESGLPQEIDEASNGSVVQELEGLKNSVSADNEPLETIYNDDGGVGKFDENEGNLEHALMLSVSSASSAPGDKEMDSRTPRISPDNLQCFPTNMNSQASERFAVEPETDEDALDEKGGRDEGGNSSVPPQQRFRRSDGEEGEEGEDET